MKPGSFEKAVKSGHLSYNTAEYHYRAGYMAEDVWRWYLFLWTWSTGRFSGAAGWSHDRAYKRLGADAYQRRINRVRRMMGLPPDGRRPCGRQSLHHADRNPLQNAMQVDMICSK